MPDVGVLNLQIHDDSAKAAEGLGRLATALGRVRNAVGGGMKLSGVANHIKALNQAMANAIPEQSLANLERLANAIEKINSSGGIKMTGIRDAMRDVEAHNPAEAVQRQVTEAMDVGLKGVESTTQETDDLLESFIKIGEAALGSARSIEAVTNEATQLSQSGVMDEIYKATHHDPEKTWIYNEKGELEIYAEYLARIAELRERIANTPVEITDAEFLKDQNAYKNTKWDIVKEDLTHKYEQLGISQSALENARSFEEAKNWSDELFQSVKQTRQAVDDLLSSLNRPVKMNWASSIDQMLGINTQAKSAADSMSAFMQGMQGDSPIAEQARELNPELQELCEEAINSGKGASELTGKMVDLDGELKKKKRDTEEVTTAFQGLKTGISRLFGPIGNLLKQFARIVRYRMIRAVIKQITEGVGEGVENYYRYSKAIKSAFAPAMDTAATALQQMKNSIGAALAPLIQSLIPLLQTVVSWFVSLVNYANQFLALIRGQATWSRATSQSAKAFDKVKKSAKGASAAVKDLLADWDELNIIQSETGGSGGGSGNTKTIKDYLGMFEEVNKFDNKIKKLVENIKKEFGDVASLAKEIGLAILAWNVGDAFAGLLGTLSSLVAAGAIIDMTFKISKMFTGTYLDTGEAGWLVGDLLATLIGGTLARTVLTNVLGGEAASIAIPLTFAVSAGASILALLEDTDVSALDTKSIGAAITAALEGGTAAGYLGRLMGQTLGESLLGGSVTALLTFGVAIGLKAVADTVDTGEITDETIKADITSAGSIGVGLGLRAATSGGGLAGTLTAAGGSALLTFGVLLGLEGVATVLEDGKITEDTITSQVIASAFVGTGLTILTGGVGEGLAGVLASLSGGSLISFGVMIGLDGAAKVAVEGKITEETLTEQGFASAIVGGGLAILAAGAGAGLAGILAAGGGGALVSFGLLVALDAIIANNTPKRVMWGNSDLTDEQVSKWVNDQMFSVNVSAAVKKINLVINSAEDLKTDIASEMETLTTDLEIIKLGLATEDTYASMKLSLFGEDGNGGVIGDLKKYAEAQKTVIKTSMTLLPVLGKNGENSKADTAEMLKAGITGWTEVEQYMSKIGSDLSKALTDGSKKGLKGFDDELIAELTNKLTNVQRAITGAQLSSTATGNLMQNLTGLSQRNAKSILDEYAKFQKELESGYNSILTQEYESYSSLEAFYRARGEKGDEEKADYYKGLADNLLAQWGERLAAGLKSSEGPGKQAIQEALSELLRLTPDDIRKAGALNKGGVQQLLSVVETAIRNSDMQNSPEVKNQFQRWLDEILKETLTSEDYSIVSEALTSGLLSYTDLFDQEAIDALLSTWQGENNPYKLALQAAWDEMLEDALGGDKELPETQIVIPVEPVMELEDAGLEYEVEADSLNGKRPWTPGRNTNAEPQMGVDRTSGVDTQVVVTMDGDQQEGNIKSGVQMGTGQLLSVLQTIAQTASAISQKRFVVNVTPSTMFGRAGAKSAEMLGAVTGEGE